MKIFIDIETGGFSIEKNGICEIAFVITDDDLNFITEYQTYIKPYKRPDSTEFVSYKPEAMEVNKIPMCIILNGKDVTVVLREIQDLILSTIFQNQNDLLFESQNTFIGHNSISFDIPRIKYLFKRFLPEFNVDLFGQEDTKVIARKKLNLESYSLENLCTHFGIENQNAHSALSDVYATIELYKKLQLIG